MPAAEAQIVLPGTGIALMVTLVMAIASETIVPRYSKCDYPRITSSETLSNGH